MAVLCDSIRAVKVRHDITCIKPYPGLNGKQTIVVPAVYLHTLETPLVAYARCLLCKVLWTVLRSRLEMARSTE